MTLPTPENTMKMICTIVDNIFSWQKHKMPPRWRHDWLFTLKSNHFVQVYETKILWNFHYRFCQRFYYNYNALNCRWRYSTKAYVFISFISFISILIPQFQVSMEISAWSRHLIKKRRQPSRKLVDSATTYWHFRVKAWHISKIQPLEARHVIS